MLKICLSFFPCIYTNAAELRSGVLNLI